MKRLVVMALLQSLTFFGAEAVAQSTTCTYSNLNTGETISGDCTSGPAGISIDTPVKKTIDGKPAIPGAMGLRRFAITERQRQGRWSVVEMNGKRAVRFEIDRCAYSIATDDLKEFLEIQQNCGDRKGGATSTERPIFMTAGGAWVGRWYTGRVGVCRTGGEGLLTYTTKKMSGYENECDIESASPRGAGIDIVVSCSGEGMTSREREYLEVVHGKLRRSVMVERKRMTFNYSRCP